MPSSLGGRSVAARAALAVVVLAIGLAASSRVAAGAEGLEHVDTRVISTRLHELTFTTPALTHPTSVRVLVPRDYDPSGTTRYPVLYLLHGGGGSYRDWTEQGDAEALTADLPVIVVMPDNNRYGNYVDWYNAGAGGPPMWETFIIGQLLPWIDASYLTTAHRDGRAVAGLSMGGGGAMGYASRHPDLFTAAAAFSGAVDTNTVPVQALAMTSGVEDGHAVGAVFGDRVTQEVRWRGHNPWDLAENLRGLFLHLTTGNGLPGGPGGDAGDPVELLVAEMMTNLHNRLTAFEIPHIWDAYGPGGHSWYYWRRSLSQLLPRLMDRFEQPAEAPSPFTYRSIDDSYAVWGWQVAIDRPALEFSRIVDAGPDGFALVGSGSAKVTTAALFEPGSPVSVQIDDADGARTLVARADDTGRLTVPVSLGPGNPHQQLSPQGNLWALGEGGAPGDWPSVTATVTLSPATVEPVEPVRRAQPDPASPAPGAPGDGANGRLPATGPATTVPVRLAFLAVGVALLLHRLAASPTGSGPT